MRMRRRNFGNDAFLVRHSKKKEKTKGPAPSGKDVVIFTRQFSVMVNAGLPPLQALDILSS